MSSVSDHALKFTNRSRANMKWSVPIRFVVLDMGHNDKGRWRIVGWAVGDGMKKDLAIRALDMAVRPRQPPEGCLFHSDRGSQYCSYDYQKKLQAHGLRPSMSGKGNCYDNASVETFFKSLKAELIWRQTWSTRRQATLAGVKTPTGQPGNSETGNALVLLIPAPVRLDDILYNIANLFGWRAEFEHERNGNAFYRKGYWPCSRLFSVAIRDGPLQ